MTPLAFSCISLGNICSLLPTQAKSADLKTRVFSGYVSSDGFFFFFFLRLLLLLPLQVFIRWRVDTGRKAPSIALATASWLGVVDQRDPEKETEPTIPRTEGCEAERRQAKPRSVAATSFPETSQGKSVSRAKGGPLSWDTPLHHQPRDLGTNLPTHPCPGRASVSLPGKGRSWMSCSLGFLPVPKSALSQRLSRSHVTLEAAKTALPIIFPHPHTLMVTEFAFIFLYMLF